MRHFQVAEAGRAAALRGDHKAALTQYREAMRIAVSMSAPEVFFRHYLEATLESLELMKAYDNVLEYCDRAILHYEANPPQHDVARLDLASIHQRRGAVLFKSGKVDQARAALTRAVELADSIGAELQLARLVLGWMSRGLAISNERLLSEQRRLHYFSIRGDSSDVSARGTAFAVPQREENPAPV